MIVSEAHRQLVYEWSRLADRLQLGPGIDVPEDHTHLRLVPALHAIVDRLERLEKDAELSGTMIAALERRMAKLEGARADLVALEESRV